MICGAGSAVPSGLTAQRSGLPSCLPLRPVAGLCCRTVWVWAGAGQTVSTSSVTSELERDERQGTFLKVPAFPEAAVGLVGGSPSLPVLALSTLLVLCWVSGSVVCTALRVDSQFPTVLWFPGLTPGC